MTFPVCGLRPAPTVPRRTVGFVSTGDGRSSRFMRALSWMLRRQLDRNGIFGAPASDDGPLVPGEDPGDAAHDQNACDADNDMQHHACGKLHEQRIARKRQGNPERKDLQ